MSDEDLIAPTGEAEALSVSQLTRAVKRLLEERVGSVAVEGEIGAWRASPSRHVYFSLKDDSALLSCVMFRGMASRLRFDPAEGDRVLARGHVSVYEQRGQYQLIVQTLEARGEGDLYKRFLELKKRLEAEGLFASERKRALPGLPRRIAVVTSPTGAALRDILQVIGRRFPCVEVLVSPSLVQGAEAPGQIVRALRRVAKWSAAQPEGDGIDVMILGRGGGSIEDLWAFNDESVARAIFESPIPVISAVGHETDFTIADFVADVRAPTPSAAAELAVAEAQALRRDVERLARALPRLLARQVETRRLELRRLAGSWGLRQPLDLIAQSSQRLDELAERAGRALSGRLGDSKHRLKALDGRLEALNPLAVLQRGYSLVSRARDGHVVTRQGQVRVGDHLRVRLSQGELRTAVLPPGDDMFDGMTTRKGDD